MASAADVEAAAAAGADAVLIGTALSAAADPDALLGAAERGARAMGASGRPRVKICGLTRAGRCAAAAARPARPTWASFLLAARGVVTPLRRPTCAGRRSGVPVFGVYGEQSVERSSGSAARPGSAALSSTAPTGGEDAARLRAEGLVVWRVVRIASPD